jgi:hypothetical protein
MQILSLLIITSRKVFRRFLEAFKRAKEYPDYPVYPLEGRMPMFPVYLNLT